MEFVLTILASFFFVIGIRVFLHKIPSIPSFTRNGIAATLLFFFGTGLIYMVSVTEVRVEEIINWSRNHWLQILLCWGMIAGLIALNKRILEEASGTSQWALTMTVLTLFVVIPIGSCITSPPKEVSIPQERRVERTRIPLTSEPRENWIKLVLPAGGKSSDIRFPVGTHPVVDGDNITIHGKYRDGHECKEEVVMSTRKNTCPDGDIPFVFFSNEKNGENVFSYAFVRD